VDLTVANSILAGAVVAVLAIWGSLLHHRLWQGTLAREGAALLDVAEAAGLARLPHGWGPWVGASGTLDGLRVELRLSGSWRGTHTRLRCGRARLRHPGILPADRLAEALAKLR